MIRKSKEIKTDVYEKRFGGEGTVTMRQLLNGPEEMYKKGRLFAHGILEVGSSLGYHVHENESETFYILRGTAEYDDNGTKVTVHPGDVTFTAAGEGHGLKNIGQEPLEYIALILYK
ncbi:MAG TPA: cupin domain-containing protein [Firmicutes bacterium]|jgi:mannose-6-phosphate isomerase-like protein (cupin superfamily)|nr:cupin domain-containing protein [Bacillota bacterium]